MIKAEEKRVVPRRVRVEPAFSAALVMALRFQEGATHKDTRENANVKPSLIYATYVCSHRLLRRLPSLSSCRISYHVCHRHSFASFSAPATSWYNSTFWGKSKPHKLQQQIALPDRGERYSIPFMLLVSVDSGRLFNLVGWRGELKSER